VIVSKTFLRAIDYKHEISRHIRACWLFNEAGAHDISGFGNDGTLVNKTFLPQISFPTKFGSAMYFDSAAAYIDFGEQSKGQLDFPTQSFSVLIWFRAFDNGNVQRLISKNYGGAGVEWWAISLDEGATTLVFDVDDGVTKSSVSVTTPDFTNLTWYQVVAVRDTAADLLRLYGNGLLLASASDGSGDIGNTYQVKIGQLGSFGDQYYLGYVDHCIIFECALTPDDVMQFYVDPFFFLLKPRTYITYSPPAAAPGLSIPIAMHHYKMMEAS